MKKKSTNLTVPWKRPQDMDEYLRPTDMVDSGSPIVIAACSRIIQGAATPREAVTGIFHYVRDQLQYGRISLYAKASQIIQEGRGNCTNKSTVMIALLRAADIPARYRYYAIRREGVKALLHPLIYALTPQVVSLNARSDVFIQGKWLTLETELDPALYRGLLKRKLLKPVDIDWDGRGSTCFLDEYVVRQLGTYKSPEAVLDNFFSSLPRFKRMLIPFGWWLSNRYIEKSRRAGSQ